MKDGYHGTNSNEFVVRLPGLCMRCALQLCVFMCVQSPSIAIAVHYQRTTDFSKAAAIGKS